MDNQPAVPGDVGRYVAQLHFRSITQVSAPYITHIWSESVPNDADSFPWSLPFVRSLEIDVTTPVTFFVGENGSGKSTLLEAIAVLSGLPMSGGGTNELGATFAFNEACPLATALRVAFRKRPKQKYFFRAETQAHFASLLESRRDDPDFRGDPFVRYGGRSLHTVSHGEAFLAVMQNWISPGLVLMDEPESALSPQRQLALLALMHDRVKRGNAQFIVATHSPLLMTYPNAAIFGFDEGNLERLTLEETTHYQITRDMLGNPAMYWQHLMADPDEQ